MKSLPTPDCPEIEKAAFDRLQGYKGIQELIGEVRRENAIWDEAPSVIFCQTRQKRSALESYGAAFSVVILASQSGSISGTDFNSFSV